MKTIKERWEYFKKMGLPCASDQQHDEAKVAFHAGIVSLLEMQIALSKRGLKQEEAAVIFEGWVDEIVVFSKERAAKVPINMPDQKPH